MSESTTPPCLPVHEIRDYHRVNAELLRLLNHGHTHIRLVRVEGQRLLASGLSGDWKAVIEIEGRAGPELAADVDAPDLLIVQYGGVADGGGRNLRAGSLVVLGDAGTGFGYRQTGGVAVVAGWSGPRAGLEQSGGCLIAGGPTGPLAGERQTGGRLYLLGGLVPNAGRGRSGGRLLVRGARVEPDPEDRAQFLQTITSLRAWLPPSLGAGCWP